MMRFYEPLLVFKPEGYLVQVIKRFITLAEFSSEWNPVRRNIQKILGFFDVGRVMLRRRPGWAVSKFWVPGEGPPRGDYVC